MKHDFIDKYSHLNSIIHRLDSRIKLLSGVLFIIFINAVNQYNSFFFYYFLLLVFVLISRVPFIWFLKKILLLLPFLLILSSLLILPPLFSGTPLPLQKIILIWFKSSLSILIITLLTSVTGFHSLLLAMEKLHFPFSIILISRFAYTYMFVLIDELHIVLRSLKSRVSVLKKNKMRVYGNISGLILLKSFSRSQMIYNSMISRNFTNFTRIKNTIRIEAKDIIYFIIFIGFLILGIIL